MDAVELSLAAALKFFWTCVALKLVDDDDDDDEMMRCTAVVGCSIC